MGYSFAAGTTDGPGDFDFTQGTNSSNKFWNFVSQFISKPTPEQVKCQAPKPILLNTGEVGVLVSVLRLLVVLVVSGFINSHLRLFVSAVWDGTALIGNIITRWEGRGIFEFVW